MFLFLSTTVVYSLNNFLPSIQVKSSSNMAWVPYIGETQSTAFIVDMLTIHAKYNPDFWTELHPCKDQSTQTAIESLKSDQVAHCMLAWYTDRYHEQQLEIEQWKSAYHKADERATRLYDATVYNEHIIDDQFNRIGNLNRENNALFNAATEMVSEVEEARRSIYTRMITEAIATPDIDMIDLTAYEAMSDTESE